MKGEGWMLSPTFLRFGTGANNWKIKRGDENFVPYQSKTVENLSPHKILTLVLLRGGGEGHNLPTVLFLNLIF